MEDCSNYRPDSDGECLNRPIKGMDCIDDCPLLKFDNSHQIKRNFTTLVLSVDREGNLVPGSYDRKTLPLTPEQAESLGRSLVKAVSRL